MQVNVVLEERHDVASLLESQDVHLDVSSSRGSDGAERRQFITEPSRALSHWIEVQIVFAPFTLPLFGPNQTGQSFTSSCFGHGVNQKKSSHASPLFHNQNDGCTIALRTFYNKYIYIIICLRGFSPYNCFFIVFIYSFMIIMES